VSHRTIAGHEHRHALHGLTVVVETDGPELWVGRCDDVVEEGVVLRDADVHRPGDGGTAREDWLARARAVGVWPRHRHVVVPAARVTAVRRLAEA
jgi:hypothetical protein